MAKERYTFTLYKDQRSCKAMPCRHEDCDYFTPCNLHVRPKTILSSIIGKSSALLTVRTWLVAITQNWCHFLWMVEQTVCQTSKWAFDYSCKCAFPCYDKRLLAVQLYQLQAIFQINESSDHHTFAYELHSRTLQIQLNKSIAIAIIGITESTTNITSR